MNLKLAIFTVLVLTALTSCATGIVPSSSQSVTLSQNWKEAQAPYSDKIQCTLKISTTSTFEDMRLQGEVQISSQEMTLTFTGLNSETPTLLGNTGEESPLSKVENNTTLYLVERTLSGNMNVFTLFRDKNILIMSKQYKIVDTPFAMQMIGDCTPSN